MIAEPVAARSTLAITLRLSLATLGVVSFALTAQAQPAPAGQSGAAFAFVLLGEGTDGDPVPMVRTVAEGAGACPELQLASGKPHPTMKPRRRPEGTGFDDVLVCEARYPIGETASVSIGGKRIALPAVSLGTPRRVLLIGDSGCRGETEQKPQSCAGGGYDKAWPFGRVAGSEAQSAPDLIVHVGDYNYRGTPGTFILPRRATGYREDLRVSVYDTGDLDDDDAPQVSIGATYWSQNIQGSPIPDSWAAWRDDFFLPAEGLLPTAPWVFTRGNHELCSRAGPGWFYLLDSASPLLGPGRDQDACPPQTPAGWRAGAWPPPPALPFDREPFPTEPSPPFRLRFGGLNLVVVDSSNAADAVLYNTGLYIPQYRRVSDMLADGTPAWIVTHRPIWGVVKKSKGGPAGDAPYGFINLTQQAAVAAVFWSGFPPNVTAVLSGHMHRFQAIGFRGGRPPQLVVGTGGMELSQVQPRPADDHPKRPVAVPDLAGADAQVVGLEEFGAMVFTLGAAGNWTSVLFSPSGETLATCDSTWPGRDDGRSICALK